MSIALLVGTTPAVARATDDSGSGFSTLDEAIAAFANKLHISVNALITSADEQNYFAVVATRIEEENPKDFAGARVSDDGFVVAFKEGAPAGALRILRAAEVQISVRENVGWSQSEITSAGEAIHFAVHEAVGDGTSTSIDTFTGRIELSVPQAGVSTAANVIERWTAENSTSSRFDIEVVAAPPTGAGQDLIYGGGSLTSCTAGFSVTASGFPSGLITAGHCPNSQTYLTGGSVPLSFRTASASRDVQWHSSSTAAPAQFFVGPSSLRNVTGKANPVVGQTLCKYGKTTGYTCDSTYIDNQCRDTYCDMMTMVNRQASGGDSGGPWFWSNTAYGVHSGYVTIWGSPRDMFTPINSGLSALGVSLKTT
jgi:hypothetical protein